MNDEAQVDEDEEGNTKVDEYGNLQGGREYRVRTFKILGRGDRLYMLSTEPARCCGFRDSYLFFAKHPKLYKVVITEAEKMDRYLFAVIRWATRKFQGHANIDGYGEASHIMEYKLVFRTQIGTWGSGFRGIDPAYIPQYVERPKDRFLKGIAEKEFRKFHASLVYVFFIHTQTPYQKPLCIGQLSLRGKRQTTELGIRPNRDFLVSYVVN